MCKYTHKRNNYSAVNIGTSESVQFASGFRVEHNDSLLAPDGEFKFTCNRSYCLNCVVLRILGGNNSETAVADLLCGTVMFPNGLIYGLEVLVMGVITTLRGGEKDQGPSRYHMTASFQPL